MIRTILLCLSLVFFPLSTFASSAVEKINLNATDTSYGILAVILFVVAYLFVMTEEFTHLRKSKPVIIASGFIWVLVGVLCRETDQTGQLTAALNHNILEFAQLFLFLIVAMTYVNVMEERLVFEALRCWLLRRQFSYRKLFWTTGILSFFMSPIADNLTTALLMSAVVMAVGSDNPKFVAISCVNIVIAANAGGAFSPFGDITTLMVWQSGMLRFFDFFKIFLPSVVSYLIPAVIMYFAIENAQPKSTNETIKLRYGAYFVVFLFFITIITAVTFHHVLHLPPMIGMMTGLGYLTFYAYYIKHREELMIKQGLTPTPAPHTFDIFNRIKHAEWDSLLFFYGVILCVGGLATFGYLEVLSNTMYLQWGANLPAAHQATPANIMVGILSAIIDNIPVMFAVLTMHPTMNEGQWLLVTLTAGIGGSMLSIGSAAGVALMGQTKGIYTFMYHLRWTWAIAIGYIAAIACHIWLAQDLFTAVAGH